MKKFGQWLAGSVATLGPWGLFLVALGDSAFIPLPQGVDALLIAQAIAAPATAWLAAAAAVIGSLIGSLALYYIAFRGGRAMLAKRVSAKGMLRLEQLTRDYGAVVLIPPMMLPLPLPTKIFVIASGVFQMRLSQFIAATVFGRAVRYFGEAAVALKYREQTTTFLKQNVWWAVAGGVRDRAALSRDQSLDHAPRQTRFDLDQVGDPGAGDPRQLERRHDHLQADHTRADGDLVVDLARLVDERRQLALHPQR